MEITKIAMGKGCLFLITVTFLFLSCDIKLISLDVDLKGTPCYISEETGYLYYRYDHRSSVAVESNGKIDRVYWNDSIIVLKNDSMKYEIIHLIPQPQEGVPWIRTGYMVKETFDLYSIDTTTMRQYDLTKRE